MSHLITLNCEDGAVHFIDCRNGKLVADPSHRARINSPLDGRDGVRGTCKAFCESGEYESTGNLQLIAADKHLAVKEFIARAITFEVEIVGDVTRQHRDLVANFELGDLEMARHTIVSYTQHSQATMNRAVERYPSRAKAATPASAITRQTLPPASHELTWPSKPEPFKMVDDGSQGDPYRHHEWMRENAPFLRCLSPASDAWFVSRYDDVFPATRNNNGLLPTSVDGGRPLAPWSHAANDVGCRPNSAAPMSGR